MKRPVLLIAGLFCIQFMMAQWITDSSVRKDMNSGTPDDSFILTPDTLWFITGNDFTEGKEFRIHNPHNYSLDVQHIDAFGVPCQSCLPWYTTPYIPSYPVSIPASDSLTMTVKFVVVDRPLSGNIYDSLKVSTAGHSGHIIIAADSGMIMIGMAEHGAEKIFAAPNPFTNWMKISLGITHETTGNVMIYNSLMQPVKEIFTGIISPGKSDFIWDGTNLYGAELSKGIYFITLRTDSGQNTLKVVKL